MMDYVRSHGQSAELLDTKFKLREQFEQVPLVVCLLAAAVLLIIIESFLTLEAKGLGILCGALC